MSIGITVPKLGESIVEATVVKWLKKEGESVTKGEGLLELETEKVNLEVNANDNGILVSIEREAGEDVQIGDLLAVLEESADVGVKENGGSVAGAIESGEYERGQRKDDHGDGPDDKVTPVARRVAADAGMPISGLEGTGLGGRIRREDVERAIALRKDNTRSPDRLIVDKAQAIDTVEEVHIEREEMIPLSRLGSAMAGKIPVAEDAGAMLTTFNEIDMSTVMTIRRRSREELDEGNDARLRFMPFFVKAVTEALKEYPALNAEVHFDSVVRKKCCDIGIALEGEGGLVMPLLRDAGSMSFAEIESKLVRYASELTDGIRSLEDQQEGSFTITDAGVFGSMLSTPLLNPQQAGILGLHRIDDRPVATEGKVVIKPMMYVALSYDGRIIDGREAEQFLGRIKSLIEIPAFLLLEV